MKYRISFLLLLISFVSFAQDAPKSKLQVGLNLSANYSFSGIGFIGNLELIKDHHIFYVGPKFPTSRSYLPHKGPWGLNVGYRHEYNKNTSKRISFFFFADYQIMGSKAFSQTIESKRRNYVHEAFIGYGMQYRISDHFYIGNSLGIGGHMEVFYNVDLDWTQRYGGYNNLFRIFTNYRF